MYVQATMLIFSWNHITNRNILNKIVLSIQKWFYDIYMVLNVATWVQVLILAKVIPKDSTTALLFGDFVQDNQSSCQQTSRTSTKDRF